MVFGSGELDGLAYEFFKRRYRDQRKQESQATSGDARLKRQAIQPVVTKRKVTKEERP